MSNIGNDTSPEIPVYDPRLTEEEEYETYHYMHNGHCIGLIEESWQGWFAISGDYEILCKTEDEARQTLIDILDELAAIETALDKLPKED